MNMQLKSEEEKNECKVGNMLLLCNICVFYLCCCCVQSNGEEVSVFVFDVKSSSETVVSCPHSVVGEVYSGPIGPYDAISQCLPRV